MSGLDKQLDEALGLVVEDGPKASSWPEAKPAIVHFNYDTKIGTHQGHPKYIEVDHLRKQVSRGGTQFHWVAGINEDESLHYTTANIRKFYSIDFFKVDWVGNDYNFLNAAPGEILGGEPGDRWGPRAGSGGYNAHKDPVITRRFEKKITFNPRRVVKIDWL